MRNRGIILVTAILISIFFTACNRDESGQEKSVSGSTEGARREEKEESNRVLIQETDADHYVMPDKYNTGCSGTLIKVTEAGTYGTLPILVADDVAKVNTMSESVATETRVSNYDFSGFASFMILNTDKGNEKKTIIFENCRFSIFRSPRITGMVNYVFKNCSFVNFGGSTASFENCYFGGAMYDCTNPFMDCTYVNCMFADISHEYPGTGDLHSDGVQIYGYSDTVASNVHFTNCRFEMPRFLFSNTKTNNTVNSCIGLMLNYNHGVDISWERCVINGGGYSIYLQPDVHTFTNISLKDIRVGCTSSFGTLYKNETNGAEYVNVRDTDTLYIGSVWKDSSGIHLSVTNDTAQARQLTVYTQNGWNEYEIEACKTFSQFVMDDTTYEDMPFDIDLLVEGNSNYIVCFDTTSEAAVQIRFVNWSGEEVYATDYANNIGSVVTQQ